MFKSTALILCLFLSSFAFGGGNHQIILTNSNIKLSHGENVGVLVDDGNNYPDFESVRYLPDTVFKEGNEPILDFNFTNRRYWLYFSISNQSDYTHFILEAGRTVTNKVLFYETNGSTIIHEYKSGDDFDYYDKEIAHRKNLFPIQIRKGQTKTFYVMLESDGELLFSPILVHERMAFFAQDFKDQFKNGFYYGLIALVVVIYFFFFLFLKDQTYLFYILYAFSQGVLQFSLDGYSHHHFFPRGGYFTNHVLLVFAGFTVIFLLTYVNRFLQLKEKSYLLWRIFTISRIVMTGIIIMSLIPGFAYEISFPIINGASLFSVLLGAFAIIRLRVKGHPVDFFFAMAFIILIIGGVVFILGNLSVVGDKLISLGALKISSALEFVVLSVSMSRKYGELQREKDEAQRLAFQNLQEKNALIDQTNAFLEKQVRERTSEIERQKEELAKSNDEIVSSIKYAQRIQQAILPSDEQVKILLPNSFVFYRPKDVVSGDFYFVEYAKTNGDEGIVYSLFGAIDCTGHGVPGAFMSIVGNNLLSQTLTEKSINSPSDALNYVNKGVHKTLRRTIEGKVIQDGMDAALCAINIENRHLLFAGAKNPLYIIRHKSQYTPGSLLPVMSVRNETKSHVLIELKGDRFSIGNAFEDVLKPFTNHEIDLCEGDQIYIFSDGYADQFGGPRKKKYNYDRFRRLLLSMVSMNCDEQKDRLEQELNAWLGEGEQIDDVLVLGVKI